MFFIKLIIKLLLEFKIKLTLTFVYQATGTNTNKFLWYISMSFIIFTVDKFE